MGRPIVDWYVFPLLRQLNGHRLVVHVVVAIVVASVRAVLNIMGYELKKIAVLFSRPCRTVPSRLGPSFFPNETLQNLSLEKECPADRYLIMNSVNVFNSF